MVIPDLEYRCITTQVRLVSRELAARGFDIRVAALAPSGPAASAFDTVPVEAVGSRRVLDIEPIMRLRRLIRSFRPDVVHGWGSATLGPLRLAGRHGARLVASAPPDVASPWLRWCLSTVDAVIAQSTYEAERWMRLGLEPERIHTCFPCVTPPSKQGVLSVVPPGTRVLMCVGPMTAHKGFKIAIWVLDILRFLYDDLHLVLVGDGPERGRLEQFARDLRIADRVHFLGNCPDALELIAAADVVWAPSERAGGEQVVLEAMAAGRPVVAAPVGGLAELVVDGETGFLVPADDKISFAKQTRRLLDDAALRTRMGMAGKERSAERFPTEIAGRQFARVFE
jgi:glycosyltransferase involved in cell wall biosynthesis